MVAAQAPNDGCSSSSDVLKQKKMLLPEQEHSFFVEEPEM
jgi:hypothetical protein